jgi:glyoxylase-like metal-dependent hydrolase (beta-lactamase superfamily II)
MSQLHIQTLVLGELQTNCYLVFDEKTRHALIIDPADSGDSINQTILDLQLKPQAIVLTHGHFDHVLGLLEVKLAWNIPIYMHSADLFLLKDAAKSAHYWLKRDVDPVPPPDIFMDDLTELKIGSWSLKILTTPGHTPGSLCLYNEKVIFTGDTLFKDAIGRTDFKYSDPQKMQKSLQKIAQLPPLEVYPGHGENTSIELEAFKLSPPF